MIIENSRETQTRLNVWFKNLVIVWTKSSLDQIICWVKKVLFRDYSFTYKRCINGSIILDGGMN